MVDIHAWLIMHEIGYIRYAHVYPIQTTIFQIFSSLHDQITF